MMLGVFIASVLFIMAYLILLHPSFFYVFSSLLFLLTSYEFVCEVREVFA
jgi:hypothetical protein